MDPIIQQFHCATTPYRAAISKLLLFGSRARGEERPDSDYDVLMIVRNKDRQMINSLYDAIVGCLLKFGRLISLKIFTETEWDRLLALKTPFSQAVMREGIPIG